MCATTTSGQKLTSCIDIHQILIIIRPLLYCRELIFAPNISYLSDLFPRGISIAPAKLRVLRPKGGMQRELLWQRLVPVLPAR